MAIELKRTSGSQATAEREPAEEPEQDDKEVEFDEALARFWGKEPLSDAERKELGPIADGQLADIRAQTVAIIQRLGKGAGKWAERGWEWEEPHWAASPESWPPVARILYLLVLLDAARQKTSTMRWYSAWPEFCSVCQPNDKRPKGHRSEPCLTHWPVVRQVKAYAANLFGIDYPDEFLAEEASA